MSANIIRDWLINLCCFYTTDPRKKIIDADILSVNEYKLLKAQGKTELEIYQIYIYR